MISPAIEPTQRSHAIGVAGGGSSSSVGGGQGLTILSVCTSGTPAFPLDVLVTDQLQDIAAQDDFPFHETSRSQELSAIQVWLVLEFLEEQTVNDLQEGSVLLGRQFVATLHQKLSHSRGELQERVVEHGEQGRRRTRGCSDVGWRVYGWEHM